MSLADKVGAHRPCCSCHASPRCDPLRGFVRIMLLGVASFSFSIRFSMRVEVLLFSGNRVLFFSGLSSLPGALYFLGELFQLIQKVVVGAAKRFHLVRLDLHNF